MTTEQPIEQEIEEFEGFTIEWSSYGHYVNFTVFDQDSNRYADGFVKWDGCTEIQETDHHWCGGFHVSIHLKLIAYLYTHAFDLMLSCQVDNPLTVKLVPVEST